MPARITEGNALKRISRVAAVSAGLAVAMAATVGFASAASAAYSTTPTGPSWTPDGPVHAIVNAGKKGQIELEASGGVTLETVRSIAQTGVERIAAGALTHSVSALDISLEIET